MNRQAKTPKQRAEEALAVINRRVEKLAADERALRDKVRDTERALAEARAIRDYAAAHPALGKAPEPVPEVEE